MDSNAFDNFENIYLHASQFPEQIYHDYLAGFKQKKIAHKFHYDTVEQSQQWLNIHKTFSPFHKSEDYLNYYLHCFEASLRLLNKTNQQIELISLGCGGGEKDVLMLSCLFKTGKTISYYPIDVSLSLCMISTLKARALASDLSIKPVVCDLLFAKQLLNTIVPSNQLQKIVSFLGMIPNFSPDTIMPILNGFINPGDILLLSANLSPGIDYLAGIKKVMYQYDNQPTKDWLFTILKNIGISDRYGEVKFNIQDDDRITQLKKITAHFLLKNDITFDLGDTTIKWEKNDRIQLFFSYRYTTEKIKKMLAAYHIDVIEYWENTTQEEGVYLCQKTYENSYLGNINVAIT